MTQEQNAVCAVSIMSAGLLIFFIAMTALIGAVGALIAGLIIIVFGIWLMIKKPFVV